MRTVNSIKNISMSIFSQLVIILLGFLSRRIFIDNLGQEYLGINGLIGNILSVITIIESGVGVGIVYNLYKPLADRDTIKVTSLVQLYKKIYGILAMVILLLSLMLYPFMRSIINESKSIEHITLIYFIFVAKNMISYFNAHKWALINADQNGYKLVKSNLLFQIITTIAKMIVLILTSNYVLFLTIEMIIYIGQTLFNTCIVNKQYPYIKTKEKYPIDKDIKDNLVQNVKAMFFHNIGGYLVFGTDNILMGKFIGLNIIGIYDGYTMIIGQLNALVSSVVNGIGASIGNLIATESKEKSYEIFKVTYLLNFWIYSFCVIFLYNVLEPFINLWLGEGNLLDRYSFIFILVNFYLRGMRTPLLTFKNKAGLFVQDKYVSLIEGIINLVVSLMLVKYLGLLGIFLGTTISTISIAFWNLPRVVYKYYFKQSTLPYFKKYFLYLVIGIITCWITTSICTLLVPGATFISLVLKGIICVIIPNLIYLGIFYKSEEFSYIFNILKPMINRINKKQVLG